MRGILSNIGTPSSSVLSPLATFLTIQIIQVISLEIALLQKLLLRCPFYTYHNHDALMKPPF